MKRKTLIVPVIFGALCLATSAWAGGSSCSGKSEGASASKEGAHCTVGTSATAKEASAGSHCGTGAGASMTSKEACSYGASHAVYSFAVNDMHCSACVKKVQSAAMAQKGVHCVHVDLDTKTAYIVAEKKVDQRAITKAVKDAGFTAVFKSDGPSARAAFMKSMAANGGANTCSAKKDKDKA